MQGIANDALVPGTGIIGSPAIVVTGEDDRNIRLDIQHRGEHGRDIENRQAWRAEGHDSQRQNNEAKNDPIADDHTQPGWNLTGPEKRQQSDHGNQQEGTLCEACEWDMEFPRQTPVNRREVGGNQETGRTHADLDPKQAGACFA